MIHTTADKLALAEIGSPGYRSLYHILSYRADCKQDRDTSPVEGIVSGVTGGGGLGTRGGGGLGIGISCGMGGGDGDSLGTGGGGGLGMGGGDGLRAGADATGLRAGIAIAGDGPRGGGNTLAAGEGP